MAPTLVRPSDSCPPNGLSLSSTCGLTLLFPPPAPILKRNAPDGVEAVELLGSWLDPNLSGTLCIWSLLYKLFRVIFLLQNLRHVYAEDYLFTVYHSFFHSHLSYQVLLWGHIAAYDKCVLLTQKKPLRIVASVGHFEHCRPISQHLILLRVYGQHVFNSFLQILQSRQTNSQKRLLCQQSISSMIL